VPFPRRPSRGAMPGSDLMAVGDRWGELTQEAIRPRGCDPALLAKATRWASYRLGTLSCLEPSSKACQSLAHWLVGAGS
jgi:hypothetical protein